LGADHVFHILVFEGLVFHLDLAHLLVLDGLLLKTAGLAVVLLRLSHLLHADRLLLIQTVLLVSHHLLVLLVLSLVLKRCLVLVVVLVTLTHPNDVVSLLLGLFDLFPGLLFLLLEEGDSIREKFNVFLGSFS